MTFITISQLKANPLEYGVWSQLTTLSCQFLAENTIYSSYKVNSTSNYLHSLCFEIYRNEPSFNGNLIIRRLLLSQLNQNQKLPSTAASYKKTKNKKPSFSVVESI